jgi:ribonuclease E
VPAAAAAAAAATVAAGDAPAATLEIVGSDSAAAPRTDRPERAEGERGGRRSRRGGRRRRRDGGEAGPRDAAGESQGPESFGDDAGIESRSFDFDREAPSLPQIQRPAEVAPVREAAPAPVAAPPAAPVMQQPREWTPSPPSDATREGPRSEP